MQCTPVSSICINFISLNKTKLTKLIINTTPQRERCVEGSIINTKARDTVPYCQVAKSCALALKREHCDKFLNLWLKEPSVLKETDELETLENCPEGLGTQHLPTRPTPNPIFLHSRQTPLNCKTDGPANLCSTKDSCDTQKVPRGSFKELDWVSQTTRGSIQKIGNNKCWWGCGEIGPSDIAERGDVKCCGHYINSGSSSKRLTQNNYMTL